LMGVSSGCIGAAVGNPSELAMVRMGADRALPEAARRNYRNSIDCCLRVAREEGVRALWRGAAPTVLRAGALNGVLLGTTSELKVTVSERTGWGASSVPTMFVAVTIASFFANAACMPFDVIKSRIQQSALAADSSMIACARKSVAEEGLLVLWRGFTPAFIKLAPYSIVSLTLMEKLTKLYTGGGASSL